VKWFDPRRCYGFCSVTGNLQDKVRISVADAAEVAEVAEVADLCLVIFCANCVWCCDSVVKLFEYCMKLHVATSSALLHCGGA
jgi:hypothetical protein